MSIAAATAVNASTARFAAAPAPARPAAGTDTAPAPDDKQIKATGAAKSAEKLGNTAADKATDKATDKAIDKASNGTPTQLSDAALVLIGKLKARDLEVRQHEAAHLAVAGSLATSGASFTYQKGPDGVNYAIGGEVGIDTSPGRTPQETIAKARTVQAAALAPADPSGPDLAIAAQAQQLAAQAQGQLAKQQAQENAPGKADSDTAKVARKDANNKDASGKDVVETSRAANATTQNQNPPQTRDRHKQLNQHYGVGPQPISGSLSVFA
jgi:hypothetical protein